MELSLCFSQGYYEIHNPKKVGVSAANDIYCLTFIPTVKSCTNECSDTIDVYESRDLF